MGNAQGFHTKFLYDKAGNFSVTIDAQNHRTEYLYDNRNRLIKTFDATHVSGSVNGNGQVVNANSVFAKTEYDKVGNVTAVVDELGHRTEYVYDSLNRQIQIFDARNTIDDTGTAIPIANRKSTSLSYDSDGNLKSLTDTVGNTTTYTYDGLNRLKTETNQLGKARSYTYSFASNQSTVTDRNNHTRSFKFDSLNRLQEEDWIDATGTTSRAITSTYDDSSQLTTLSDPDSINSFTYYKNGWLKSVDNAGTLFVPAVKFSYQYDANGNLTQTSDRFNNTDQGVTTYNYDSRDQLTAITQQGSGTGIAVQNKRVEMSYNPVGQINSLKRFSDATGTATNLVATTTYGYDARDRLTTLNSTLKGGVTRTEQYTYFDNGLIQTKTDLEGVNTYAYTKDNQLLTASRTSENYTYDANGNRTNAGYTTPTGSDNRLQTDGTFNYLYDDEGNLIKRTEIATGKVREFSWDYRDRLISVVDKNAGGAIAQQSTFTYDALDRRIAKTTSTGGAPTNTSPTTYFVYDGSNVALEFTDPDGRTGSASPTLSTRYLFGPGADQILAQETYTGGVGTTTWMLTDYEGSVRDLIDNTGAVRNHYVYDSFGKLLSSQPGATADTRYRYTGREWENETGLYYYRARYYDPATGRFLGQDPQSFGAGDSNLYRYVGNSPTNATDPSGEFLQIAGGAAIGFLGGGAFDLTRQVIDNHGFNNINWGEVGGSAVVGAGAVALIAAYPPAAGALLVGGTVLGLANGANDVQNGRYDLAAFDVGTALLPFATKGGRANTFESMQNIGRLAAEGPKNAFDLLSGLGTLKSKLGDLLCPQCFVAGTLILTSTGKKAIEELRHGDWVLSWNERTGEVIERPVTEWYRREAPAIMDIFIRVERISCTVDHPFWVEGKGWVLACHITSGTVLQTHEGASLVVDVVRRRNEVTPVYNVEIEGLHTYFVSNLEILSHNACGQPVRPVIQEHDITTYADFTKRSVKGDNIEGHELLQNSWLKKNGHVTRRLKGSASKDNPVIALEKAAHKGVNSAQKGMDVATQSARQNIEANRRILLDQGISPEKVNHLTRQAVKHAQSLGIL